MYTLFPSTTLFRSHGRLEEIDLAGKVAEGQEEALKRSSHRCRPGASPYGIKYLAWLSRDSQAFSQTVIAGLVPAIHASTRLLTSLERCRGKMGPRDKPEGDNRSWWRRLCDCRRRCVNPVGQIGRAHV